MDRRVRTRARFVDRERDFEVSVGVIISPGEPPSPLRGEGWRNRGTGDQSVPPLVFHKDHVRHQLDARSWIGSSPLDPQPRRSNPPDRALLGRRRYAVSRSVWPRFAWGADLTGRGEVGRRGGKRTSPSPAALVGRSGPSSPGGGLSLTGAGPLGLDPAPYLRIDPAVRPRAGRLRPVHPIGLASRAHWPDGGVSARTTST